MHLLVGLGNPTNRYKNNRHNVGFMTIDFLIDRLKPSSISKSSFKGELYKSNDILLLKPQTFMNLSGESVMTVANFYKIDINNIIVIHDDLDLLLGVIRFKKGGGHGGHNGLKSIDGLIGRDYKRVRIGIGRPLRKGEVVSYVLSDFKEEEKECLQKVIKIASDAALMMSKKEISEVSNKFSSKKSICI